MASSATSAARGGNAAPPAAFRLGWISLLAALVGALAGLIAFLLYDLIALFTNLVFYHQWSLQFRSPEHTAIGPWIVAMPVIGGLVSGLMAKYGSRKIRGHGIPEAIEAVLSSRSRIDPKVAILKPLSAAIGIGTGGPFGAEGPIIQTGGAFGSLVGQLISTTASERKTLLACGACAGMAATFNTPIAGVILAIELLLFEFRARSFIPLVIASTLATSVRVVLFGQRSMFAMRNTNFDVLHGLPYYVLLGVVCGGAAIALTKTLYWVEDRFERLPIDEMWHPAIGMSAVGVIGFFMPRILGVGYDTISDILNGNLTMKLLILIALFKLVAVLFSLGSGTSGGLLAPTFMWSSALGGAFAMLVNRVIPSAHLSPGAYALVAMAAVFGAASRATFALIVFAFEITGDYNAILPLMLGCVIADLIALRCLPTSIMTERLARRGLNVSAEYEVGVIQVVRVGDVMQKDVQPVLESMTVAELVESSNGSKPLVNLGEGLPIIAKNGRLKGIVTQSDLLRAFERDPEGELSVADAGSASLIVAYPDELVADALHRMLHNDVGRLPVVTRQGPSRMVGYLTRSGILSAWTRQLEEEGVREEGWLARLRRAANGSDASPT